MADTFGITSGMADNISSWEKSRANWFRTFFAERSYFYLFVEDRLRLFRGKIRAGLNNYLKPSNSQKLQDKTTAAKEPWTYSDLYYNWDAVAFKMWDLTMRDLLEMNRIGKTINAKTMFVYLPDQFVSGRVKLDGKVNLEKPDSMFFEFMRENKMYALNLVPVFKKSELPILYIHDGHFNDAGSRLAAEEIFNEIRKWAHPQK